MKGKVAVVTGASRGGGRGIALALGEAGATVYVTGRSTRRAPTRADLPGTTIEDTAEQVTARGGAGIPVRCDHTDDAQVTALFERVQSEHDRLDILVNNVWGGYENYDPATFDAPFWEQPLWRWDRMFTAGVRAHFAASRLAAMDSAQRDIEERLERLRTEHPLRRETEITEELVNVVSGFEVLRTG